MDAHILISLCMTSNYFTLTDVKFGASFVCFVRSFLEEDKIENFRRSKEETNCC